MRTIILAFVLAVASCQPAYAHAPASAQEVAP